MPVKIVTMGVAMAIHRRISITGSLCGRLENGHLGKFSASNQPLAFAEGDWWDSRDFQQNEKPKISKKIQKIQTNQMHHNISTCIKSHISMQDSPSRKRNTQWKRTYLKVSCGINSREFTWHKKSQTFTENIFNSRECLKITQEIEAFATSTSRLCAQKTVTRKTRNREKPGKKRTGLRVYIVEQSPSQAEVINDGKVTERCPHVKCDGKKHVTIEGTSRFTGVDCVGSCKVWNANTEPWREKVCWNDVTQDGQKIQNSQIIWISWDLIWGVDRWEKSNE